MMDEICFLEKVKSTFAFLESEYGFRVIREMNSPMHPLTDEAVDYTSGSTVVTIDSEMGCAPLHFYRLWDGRQYGIRPVDIHEYLSTREQEKELLLSPDPADGAAASALSNKIFLLNQPGWKDISGRRVDLEKDPRNFSDWLRACQSINTGRFFKMACAL